MLNEIGLCSTGRFELEIRYFCRLADTGKGITVVSKVKN